MFPRLSDAATAYKNCEAGSALAGKSPTDRELFVINMLRKSGLFNKDGLAAWAAEVEKEAA